MYSAAIIDDEKWVVRSLTSTIEGQEFFTIIGEAYDGLSGLELIREKKPDLAFVDIQMPGMGGLELLQSAHEEQLPTLFIMISGYAEFAYAQKAMFYNAIGYCLKPFSKSELFEAMGKAFLLLEANSKEVKPENEEVNAVSATPSGSVTVSNRMVQSMLDYTHEHYTEDISIQNLAELCSINPNYASQLFSQEVGITYSTYLTKLRIKKASQLLTCEELPVASISARVGYHDYFYFAKVFKKITGFTPTAYRNHVSR
jgi:two-component system response regulator YesN